jgi:hypothetical protein
MYVAGENFGHKISIDLKKIGVYRSVWGTAFPPVFGLDSTLTPWSPSKGAKTDQIVWPSHLLLTFLQHEYIEFHIFGLFSKSWWKLSG